VIDGSGGPAADDQVVIIEGDHISRLGPVGGIDVPSGTPTLDLRGRTIIPGLVGMHDHLFYQIEADRSSSVVIAPHTFARLYLASGVTTIRTAGTADFDVDAQVKRRIDARTEPGPKIHLTGPYLMGTTTEPDPDGIAHQVAKYADRGATSFKA
jgi:imidazolonepropionase-like amidohydrolase